MSNVISVDQYIKEGNKLYRVGGGSAGASIITANSLEEAPADAADGTILLVPSEGGDTPSGGGLQVIKLTTQPTEDGAVLTDEESAAMENAFAKGVPFIGEFTITTDVMTASTAGLFAYGNVSAGEQNVRMLNFADIASRVNYIVMSNDGSPWIFVAQTMG